MYSYIRGTVVETQLERVIVDVHGIGFCLFIAPNHHTKLPPQRSEVCLHTVFVIREFSQALYGFVHMEERDLFEKLLDISGVGPKLALNIVGHLSPQDLQQALFNKDVSLLCRVPGIGKKTAERLLLELKNALPATAIRIQPQGANHIQDAISALVNLGYSPQASQSAVCMISEKEPLLKDVGALITKSLQHL